MKSAARIYSILAILLFGSLSLSSQSLKDKLIAAIDAGKVDTVRSLLAQVTDLNAKDDQGYTPLQHAVMAEQADVVLVLLNAGSDTEVKSDVAGNTALHWAVIGDNLEILRALLTRGANLEVRNNDGLTPLIFAAANNKPVPVNLLVSKGANVEARDNYNRTPLMWAARNCPVETATLLLNHGANLEAVNNEGANALVFSGYNKNHADMTAFLQERFAALGVQRELNNKLAAAIAERSPEQLKLLLDAGADIEANLSSDFKAEGYYSTTLKNVTPLIWAVAINQPELVKLLLSRHANIDAMREGAIDCYHFNVKVEGSMTPLTLAIEMGKMSMVQLLADQGANLEQRDAQGRTPLLFAIDKIQVEIVKYLLKRGADPGVKDKKGLAALQHAALAGNVEVGKLLQSGDLQYRQLEQTQWKDNQEQFTAYVRALSSDPQSLLLRRRVIQLGTALPAAPALPEVARQLFVQASQQLQQARTPNALDAPIELLHKVVDLAPWWGNGYYNLGVALQMHSKFDDAITMFNYYLDSKPSADDAAEAQMRIQATLTAKSAAR